MKYFNYIAVALFFLNSCSLKEEPVDKFSSNTFYDGSQSLVTGVNGCYSPLVDDNYYGTNFRRNTEYYSDVCSGTADGYLGNQGFYVGNMTPSHPQIIGTWTKMYNLNTRCNTFLDAVEKATNATNDTIKTRVVGEARFLRALNYFNLVRCWGEVPLRKSVVTDYINQVNIAVSTRKEIFDFIIQDLKYAEQYCWNYNETKAKYTNDIGRTTSLAATTLLAKVYLTIASSVRVATTPGFTDNGVTGVCDDYLKGYTADSAKAYYQLCLAECQKGLAHPDFFMETAFSDLWRIDNRFSREFLFSTQYANASGYYSSLPGNYLPMYSTLGASSSNVDGTLNVDTRYLLINTGNSALQNFPIDTADLRFKEGCLMTFQRYEDIATKSVYRLEYFDPSSKKLNPRYVRWDWDKVKGTFVRVSLSAISKVYFKKFQDPLSPDKVSSRTGYPILRSVDLLLMAGEASAEISGNPVDSYPYFNQARLRGAGKGRLELNNTLIASFPGATSMDKFREFVMRERLLEFAGESDRMFTLFRMGTYLTKCNLVATTTDGAGLVIGNGNKLRQSYHYHWPISQQEIDGNNLVKQSVGY